MMYSEFCELAGYEVKYEDYKNFIEPMYMAVPESVSKREFIEMVNRERFEVKPLVKLAREIKKGLKVGHPDWEVIREYAMRKWGSENVSYYNIYSEIVIYEKARREIRDGEVYFVGSDRPVETIKA